MGALSSTQIGIGIACLLAAVVYFNWDEIKAKLPTSIGGGVSMTKLSGDMSDLLIKSEKAIVLSAPGRSSLSDVMIFLERPISMYPDTDPRKKAAMDGRQAIYDLFGSAPITPAGTPAQSTSVT